MKNVFLGVGKGRCLRTGVTLQYHTSIHVLTDAIVLQDEKCHGDVLAIVCGLLRGNIRPRSGR